MYRATSRPRPFPVVAAFALALAALLATAGHAAAIEIPGGAGSEIDLRTVGDDGILRFELEATQEGDEEPTSGAVVPSELSERSLTGSYVVTAGAVAIVVALIVAQRMRNRRAD